MNRKEFLETIWRKGVKPLVVLTLLAFSVQFFINVFKENSSERVVILLLFGVAIIFLLIFLAGIATGGLIQFLTRFLPPRASFWIKMTLKFFNYLIPILTGALAYHFWLEDQKVPVFILGFLIIEHFSRMIKQERTKYNNS